jgi:hypothetical protein
MGRVMFFISFHVFKGKVPRGGAGEG